LASNGGRLSLLPASMCDSDCVGVEAKEMKGHNIMPEVAAALGVELGEPFAIENSTDNTIEWFKLTIDGAFHFIPDIRGFCTLRGIKGDWYQAGYILEHLLIGKRVWIREKVKQESLF
jgi:hypothetical protein